jgi:hypothetical protein
MNRRNVCPELDQRLNAYVTAASADSLRNRVVAVALSAAGVSLGLTPPAAEAKVILNKTDIVLRDETIFEFDLNSDGLLDFGLQIRSYEGYYGSGQRELDAFGITSTDEVVVNKHREAVAGKLGQQVGADDPFLSGGAMCSFNFNHYGSSSNGPWHKERDRFLGVKFNVNGETHYGWIRISVSAACEEVQLSEFAYETVANKALKAGMDNDGNAIPASIDNLGALATGVKRFSFPRRVPLPNPK